MDLLLFLLFVYVVFLARRVNKIRYDSQKQIEDLEFNIRYLNEKISNLKKTVENHDQDKKSSVKTFKLQPTEKVGAEKLKTQSEISIDDSKTGVAAANIPVKAEVAKTGPAIKKPVTKLSTAAGGGAGSLPPETPDLTQRWYQFKDNVDWEQFTGTKLTAWLSGVALFIGAGFFVKYSIDHALISAIMRLIVGSTIGLGMIVASGYFARGKFDVMRQSLASGGIGVLYAVFFAATLHYEYLDKPIGFACLVVVSAAAFALALFHKGIAVSVLGAIGAYLTPLLVNTGQGSLVSMVVYLSIVNIGLYQVVKKLDSSALLLFATAGTSLSLGLATIITTPAPEAWQIAFAWVINLFVFASFLDLFKPRSPKDSFAIWAMQVLFVATAAASLFLITGYEGSGALVVLTALVCALVTIAFRNEIWVDRVIPIASLTYVLAFGWTLLRFNAQLSPMAFFAFFLYGFFAGLGPVILIYRHGVKPAFLKWFRIFPVGIAMLSLIAIFFNPNMSYLFWPMTFAVQIICVTISLVFGAVFQVVALAFILLLSFALWLGALAVVPISIFAFYSLLLAAALTFLLTIAIVGRNLVSWSETLRINAADQQLVKLEDMNEWLTVAPVAGFYGLIALSFYMFRPLNVHPGMFTLLCFSLLALVFAYKARFAAMGGAVLACAALPQAIWAFLPKAAYELSFASLLWSGSLFVIALILPFAFYADTSRWKKTWAGWALFEIVQSVYFLFAADMLWSRDFAGWFPVSLFLLKTITVAVLIKRLRGKSERNTILACHGAAMLFYFSATPFLLLENGWFGLVLVFEATALLWLNTRIEHPGLPKASAVLAPVGLFLVLSFLHHMKTPESMTIFNPAVLSVFFATLALAWAVRLRVKSGSDPEELNMGTYFRWLFAITGFFFVNLVIADIFASLDLDPGQRLFKFIPPSVFVMFQTSTAGMALSVAGGWITYGLFMHLWPNKLGKPFRIAGFVLIILGFFRMANFPFSYNTEFGLMQPIMNYPTLLHALCIGLLGWLVWRKPDSKWPFASLSQKKFWGVMLATVVFYVLNIQIASAFGDRQAFSLLTRGRFEHQLAYSLGWLIYAISLLVAGIKWKLVGARQASLLFIMLTSLKIFFKDLWDLGNLYRVAAFIGLAAVSMLVSYLYQRFLIKTEGEKT